MSARDIIARAVSEKTWQAQIEQLAGLHGWLTYHTHDSRRSAAGFPDCLLIRGDRLVVAELKRETGRVTPEQLRWLDAFNAAGAETFVWRPSQWDHVVEVLR